MKRIYIAGPISGKEVDYIQNVSRMCQAGAKVWGMGYSPFVPGLDFLTGLFAKPMGVEDYKRVSFDFLEVCDAMVYIGLSPGVVAEMERARELMIPIYEWNEFLDAFGEGE